MCVCVSVHARCHSARAWVGLWLVAAGALIKQQSLCRAVERWEDSSQLGVRGTRWGRLRKLEYWYFRALFIYSVWPLGSRLTVEKQQVLTVVLGGTRHCLWAENQSSVSFFFSIPYSTHWVLVRRKNHALESWLQITWMRWSRSFKPRAPGVWCWVNAERELSQQQEAPG